MSNDFDKNGFYVYAFNLGKNLLYRYYNMSKLEFQELSVFYYGKVLRPDFGVHRPLTLSGEKNYAIYGNTYDEWGDLEFKWEALKSKTLAILFNEANEHYWIMKIDKLKKKYTKEAKKKYKGYCYDLVANQYEYRRKKHYDINFWFNITNEELDGRKVKHYCYINALIKRKKIIDTIQQDKFLTKHQKDMLGYKGEIWA